MKIPEIGIPVIDLLIQSELCKTRSEAIRCINQGAVKLDDVKIKYSFTRLFLYEGNYYLLEVENA